MLRCKVEFCENMIIIFNFRSLRNSKTDTHKYIYNLIPDYGYRMSRTFRKWK